MNQCNRCTFEKYKEMPGVKIVTKDDPAGGVNVYMIPEDETFDKKHLLAWFMFLPDECEC